MEKKRRNIVFFGFVLICIGLSSAGFADTRKFSADSVSSFDVSLWNENITVSTCSGREILVISETDDESMTPDVMLDDGVLKIVSGNTVHDGENVCNISLQVPETFVADKVSMKISCGRLDIKKLTAETVILSPGPDNSMENIKADYFEIPLPDQADMNISNLDSSEINIYLLAGNVNLSMLRIPERQSRISSKYGMLNISFPVNGSFTINARSFLSKFMNRLNGSTADWIREGTTYSHNGGGVVITLQTHEGDILVGE